MLGSDAAVCIRRKTMIADFEHHEEGCGPTKEIAAPTLSTSNGYLNIEGGKYRVV